MSEAGMETPINLPDSDFSSEIRFIQSKWPPPEALCEFPSEGQQFQVKRDTPTQHKPFSR